MIVAFWGGLSVCSRSWTLSPAVALGWKGSGHKQSLPKLTMSSGPTSMKKTPWDEYMDKAAEAATAGETMVAPPTDRNKDAILDVLKKHLPAAAAPKVDGKTVKVLEVASGTGQHSKYMGDNLPSVVWQPSDCDPRSPGPVGVWTAGMENVLPYAVVDASAPDTWPLQAGDFDGVVCCNMIHIAPYACAEGLVKGAGRVCRPGAKFFIYGPFKVGGVCVPHSNADFDQMLRNADPSFGLRDFEDIDAKATEAGFRFVAREDMPANNFMCVWEKLPAP